MIFWDQSEKHTSKKCPVYSGRSTSKCFCASILARRLLQQIESENPVPWYEETPRGLGASTLISWLRVAVGSQRIPGNGEFSLDFNTI